MNWKIQIENELKRGEDARAAGNEGQARVCARRAAGIAVREYWERRGITVRNPSAYEILGQLVDAHEIPPEARQAAVYLTLRVTEEFQLSVEVDLLAEARRLCKSLLPDFDA